MFFFASYCVRPCAPPPTFSLGGHVPGLPCLFCFSRSVSISHPASGVPLDGQAALQLSLQRNHIAGCSSLSISPLPSHCLPVRSDATTHHCPLPVYGDTSMQCSCPTVYIFFGSRPFSLCTCTVRAGVRWAAVGSFHVGLHRKSGREKE